MAAPKKFEERALTRQKTEDFIHEVVNYVAKHRRSQWTQLSDAGETTIILETDSTNLLPAIARQSRNVQDMPALLSIVTSWSLKLNRFRISWMPSIVR